MGAASNTNMQQMQMNQGMAGMPYGQGMPGEGASTAGAGTAAGFGAAGAGTAAGLGTAGVGTVAGVAGAPASGTAETRPAGWICPRCGTENHGKFCGECGNPRPVSETWTCSCGTQNKGKFCSECGKPRP